MVKSTSCPIKPKSARSKRLVQKRRAKATAASDSSILAPNSRLTGEELAELRRLGQILPIGMRATNPQNDPLRLIQNAAQYINHLTSTLVARIQNGSLPQDMYLNLSPRVLNKVSLRQRSQTESKKKVSDSATTTKTTPAKRG